jgi:thiamine biosynthesis protein ThiS
MSTCQITVNGADRTVPTTTTLPAVVAQLTDATTGIAVAVNNEVVPRSQWAGTVLQEGDAVEVITAMQGG